MVQFFGHCSGFSFQAAFDLDLRKNFEPAIQARLGAPLITIPNLPLDLTFCRAVFGGGGCGGGYASTGGRFFGSCVSCLFWWEGEAGLGGRLLMSGSGKVQPSPAEKRLLRKEASASGTASRLLARILRIYVRV